MAREGLAGGRIRIGIGHPIMGRGGSEARAIWAIEALKDDYDVSLITTRGIDLGDLNRFYGTALEHDHFHFRKAPVPFFINRVAWGDAIRGAFYQRFCRRIAPEFDVLISAYNICDFGVPAIQCIADFSWDDNIRKRLHPPPPGNRGFLHRNILVRRFYLLLASFFANPSGRNLFAGEDLILANSEWSAKMIQKQYGVKPIVLYPPVSNNLPRKSVDKKEWGFVCIGRISTEKRIERVIRILKTVRARGYDIHLHVIGKMNNTAYGRSIERLSETNEDWVFLEGERFGFEKTKVLSQHCFGIHACKGEAFGIAVAEMVKAGCITFVPDEGGQTEIVNHPLLVYQDVGDAVEKIENVLSDPELYLKLQNHLEMQGRHFTTSAFVKGIKSAVRCMLERFH